MSWVGVVARLGLTGALLAILLVAQLDGHDDWWPLGTLGQYAVARDPGGTVLDTYVLGVGQDGTTTELPLRASHTGLTRVELELNLGPIIEDPTRLASVALAYEQRHPDTDLVALEVRQRVHQLHRGGRSGPPSDHLLVRWDEP